MFVFQVLQSIKIKVKLPIIVQVDNVGAIFKTKNITTTGCSKHVDKCYKFLTEYSEDRVIKVILSNHQIMVVPLCQNILDQDFIPNMQVG